MNTPYVPHLFGINAEEKLKSRRGWLTAGVASSIPWPQEDVWVLYDGHEYVLRGTKGGEDRKSPCISTPCPTSDDVDSTATQLYKFASILGWFKGGYVDVTGIIWGSIPVLYGSRDTFTSTLHGGKHFDCNYLPVIEDDQVRKALAFLREGRRLRHVHEPYAFLSFFKVLESQFIAKERVAWIEANLNQLDGDAATRVEALRAEGVDVSKHLFDSGRCAVAHASLGGAIVDPDIPADRRRITNDLDVIAALASRYLKVEAGVPDEMELYRNRDRTTPWHRLLPEETLRLLQQGGHVEEPSALGQLHQTMVSVRLWPHVAPEPMRNMTLVSTGCAPGIVHLLAHNERQTIVLRFAMDLSKGRLHTMLEHGGLTEQFNEITEGEIEHYTRYVHSVIANALVELCIEGLDPVPCEIVIPRNVIPQAPEEMVALALDEFRKTKAKAGEGDTPSDVGSA